MSENARQPVRVLVGVTMGSIIVIIASGLLVGLPIASGSSDALSSTGSSLNAELPFIALILAAGIALGAASGRRRRG